ncbi:hypothetical protein EJB05_32181, partial [Eragrostis curvula]
MESRQSKCGSTEEPEDRLTGLPDGLLHSILHGLSLKDVVCTSGISRQWATTWVRALATSPVLDFMDRAFVVRQAPAQVVALVSLYLKRHADQGAPLDVLRVALDGTLGGAKAFGHDVVGWVAYAVARGAREVEVDMTPKQGDRAAQHDNTVNEEDFFVALPSDLLLARNSLVRLALDRFSLRAVLSGAPAGFAGLRSLSLSHANVTDDEVNATLSSCRLLEFLSLRSCHLLRSVRIVGHKLRGLDLVTCLGIQRLRVTEPALESFAFHGDIIYLRDSDNFSAVDLGDTPTLRDVCLSHIGFGNMHLVPEYEYGFFRFSNRIARAKSLTLCSVGLKLPGEQVETSDVFDALNHEIYELDDCIYIDKFGLDCLRLIKVVNFQGTWAELALLAFLLQGAPALEQLVLVTVEEEQGASGDTPLKLILQRVSEMTEACVTLCGPSEDRTQNPAHTRFYHME